MLSTLAGLPIPMALAAVALLGYLVGNWRRRRIEFHKTNARRELRRAKSIIRSLEDISTELRSNLTQHQSSIRLFRQRVGELAGNNKMADWRQLSEEADRALRPTMRLATQIAQAYDELRQQMNLLMTFTEIRTDPLTGLSNRRGMDDSLDTLFGLMSRYGNPFSIMILDVDHFKRVNDEQGHLFGDQILQKTAILLEECARDTDIVVRYGGEEFVILMPETELDGATAFAERVRMEVEQDLPITVSCGAATAGDGDTGDKLFSRADQALYKAKNTGRNAAYGHNGTSIEPAFPPHSDEVVHDGHQVVLPLEVSSPLQTTANYSI
jgi:diguanylate cyclase